MEDAKLRGHILPSQGEASWSSMFMGELGAMFMADRIDWTEDGDVIMGNSDLPRLRTSMGSDMLKDYKNNNIHSTEEVFWILHNS